MNTQLEGGKSGKHFFFLVESTKNFLIYLIASPRAIWCPCLDRCVSFSLLRLSLEGDCQHPGRIAEARNLVTLSRSGALSATSCTPLRELNKACSKSHRARNLKFSSWVWGSWGSLLNGRELTLNVQTP